MSALKAAALFFKTGPHPIEYGISFQNLVAQVIGTCY